MGRIGSLKHFTNLKRLEISLPVLLGWTPDFPKVKLRDVVPVGLQELCLRDDLFEKHCYGWKPFPVPADGEGVQLYTQLKDYLPLEKLCIKIRIHCWFDLERDHFYEISDGAEADLQRGRDKDFI